MGLASSCSGRKRKGRYTTKEVPYPYDAPRREGPLCQQAASTAAADPGAVARQTATSSTASRNTVPIVGATSYLSVNGKQADSATGSLSERKAARSHSVSAHHSRSGSRQLSRTPSLAVHVANAPHNGQAHADRGAKRQLRRRHTVQPPSMRVAARSTTRLGNNYTLNSASPRTLAFAVDYIGCDYGIPFRQGYLPTDASTIGALERQYTQRKPPYRQVVLLVTEERLTIFDSYDFDQVVHRLPLLGIVQVDARHDTITIVEDTSPAVRSCHVMRSRVADESHAIVNIISHAFHRAFTKWSDSPAPAPAMVVVEDNAVERRRKMSLPIPERPSRTVSLMDMFNVHRDLLITPDEDGRNERLQLAKSHQSLVPGDTRQGNMQRSPHKQARNDNIGDDPSKNPVTSPASKAASKASSDGEGFSRDKYRHSIRLSRPGLRDSENSIKAMVRDGAHKTEKIQPGSCPVTPTTTNNPSGSSSNKKTSSLNYLLMTYDELLDSVDSIMGTPVSLLRLPVPL